MMTTILIFNFFASLIFLKSINPLTLGLTLISQTLLMSILLGTMTKSFWVMYLLILTFIGGMLVLFIYVTSIFPNEKFFFNQNNLYLSLFMMMALFFLLTLYTNFFNINLTLTDQTYNFPSPNQEINHTTKMFFSSTSLILIFLVMYLFYCMIVVIKITNFHKGPLRKMN